jgi:cytochrome d ubiquinol oxidase subunit II
METVAFLMVITMLAAYAVMDGFDFGVGVLHRLVARTDDERRTVLAAIGPVWEGNEVLLVAAGGVLFMTFPRVYAASFSGFYLALMLVLWLLILRGIALTARSHQESPLWREFWDTVFSLASGLLAIVLGAALGNVVRGVPLDSAGYFAISLFTDFRPGERPGILDWYTTLVGLLTFCVLAGHGALYLAWKTTGAVQARSRVWAQRAWLAAIPLWALATIATGRVQPTVFSNLLARPWSIGLGVLMLGGACGVFCFLKKEQELRAFLSSCAFILGLMAATMAGNYPYWLRSTLDPADSLTVFNAAAQPHSLMVGMICWIIAAALATSYYVYVYRTARGKVGASGGHGY